MNQSLQAILKNPLINLDGSITPRPCSRKDLAMVYGVTVRTIYGWLKDLKHKINITNARRFNQKQIIKLFELLGEPPHFDIKKMEIIQSHLSY